MTSVLALKTRSLPVSTYVYHDFNIDLSDDGKPLGKVLADFITSHSLSNITYTQAHLHLRTLQLHPWPISIFTQSTRIFFLIHDTDVSCAIGE